MASEAESRRIARMKALVAALCSPDCAGRRAGTEGGERARALIIDDLVQNGLEPAGTCDFRQPVPPCNGENILARAQGQGRLARRSVLVAAHYDHLGTMSGQIFPGADDNAAAVSILLDVAARIQRGKGRLGREVLFCFFDAEEPPFYLSDAMGSVFFVQSRHVPTDRIDQMICMDLLGHPVGPEGLPREVRRSMFILGAEKSRGTAEIVDRISRRAEGLFTRRLSSDMIPALSDYYAFELERVPFLFLTSGRWAHYHSVTDTPEKLDFEKMAAIADYLEELIVECSTRDDAPVEFLEQGRDDRSMLASLTEVATLMCPQIPQAREILDTILVLEKELARSGSLEGRYREALPTLVMTLEAMLE
jgi:hypothetical protein